MLLVLALVVTLVVAAVAWFLLGRERPTELSDDQALSEFRATSGSAAAAGGEGRPEAGVYSATASGRESIGLPGFDEELGPNAPVTVTHGADGCSTFRADFNSHHWRSWTFCATATAAMSLTGLESWTARRAPGLDLETRSTYTCDEPLDVLWDDAATGQRRTGACTGTSDLDDSVTEDAASIEVLDPESIVVGGDAVDAVRVRITDTFSGAQTGSEVGEWWLHPDTGLPLRVDIDAELRGGAGDYRESFRLELSTLRPES